MITVSLARTEADLEAVFRIRKIVFVDEQRVPEAEEYDEFEATSRHLLALLDGQPCGTARWRKTPGGVKMERFAVLPQARSQGVGAALVQAVLADVAAQPDTQNRLRYLHAQVSAMPLYTKFGFVAEGALFYECEIPHFKMTLAP